MQSPATRGAIGWCLEPHDLVVSKYVANREKDRVFCGNALRHGIVAPTVLIERARTLDLDAQRIASIVHAIERDAREMQRSA